LNKKIGAVLLISSKKRVVSAELFFNTTIGETTSDLQAT